MKSPLRKARPARLSRKLQPLRLESEARGRPERGNRPRGRQKGAGRRITSDRAADFSMNWSADAHVRALEIGRKSRTWASALLSLHVSRAQWVSQISVRPHQDLVAADARRLFILPGAGIFSFETDRILK